LVNNRRKEERNEVKHNTKETFLCRGKRGDQKEKNKMASSSSGEGENRPTMLVAVRVRPESDKEKHNPISKVVVQALDEQVIVFDPPTPVMSLTAATSSPSRRLASGAPSNYRKAKDAKYAFHRVFDANSTQEEVYEATAKTLIADILEGFNATVFAYGATGAGKTHTMIGSADDPGVMVRTTRDLFDAVEERRSTGVQCELVLSYLEIYNETIRDLLAYDNSSSGNGDGSSSTTSQSNNRMPPALELREDATTGTVAVSGLSQHRPQTADDVFELLARGNNNRRQSPTMANAVSSRSHAVLQIVLVQRDKGSGTTVAIKTGKLSLIDLAGSERAAVTKNRGERLIEGANINRSLLALANCINALCAISTALPSSKTSTVTHIPYRDSKLTRLLKDSLGGNCRTVMIASVSPSSLSYEDTHNTLKYAHRASAIKPIARTRVGEYSSFYHSSSSSLSSSMGSASNGLKANVMTVNAHVTEYKQIIDELKAEVARLRQQQQQQQKITNEDSSRASRVTQSLISNFNQRYKLKDSIRQLRLSSFPAFGRCLFTFL